jgi:iron complex outermembrane recepter protein
MRTKLFAGVAFAALMLPVSAFAQSSGTIDAEEGSEIVVTGTGTTDIGGIRPVDTSKTRQVLTSELIQRSTPGQSINEVINMIPGVSFQNNDPYGSSGGTLTIRGFDSSRISQTFDGIPLNDTGNYAIYSNQQLDMELIDQVNVNLGTTDVDSPTASATGSTVNYRSITPSEDFHVRLQGSLGSYDMFRVFGLVETGNFTPWGTRAWVSASSQTYNNPYNSASGVNKQQYNAKLYQPIGSNGDFIWVAGHYNENRNNNFSSGYLRTDTTILNSTTGAVTGTRVVGTSSSNRFPTTRDDRDYDQGSCTVPAGAANVPDTASSCGSAYDYSYNPSNTGNIRGGSRFTLAPGLVLTVDPSYQYTKANGGSGTYIANEGLYTNTSTSTTSTGVINNSAYFNTDLNGDGDKLDTVRLYAPSQTQTNRYIVISSLRYDLTPTQTVRVAYTHDYGIHRQTAEFGTLLASGYTSQYFPVDDALTDSTGGTPERRNRKSRAILDQVSGEYRGKFLDETLTVNAGIRAPFFKRKLDQRCVTINASGNVSCFSDATAQAQYLAANPTFAGPQQRDFSYSAVLPSAGVTYELAPKISVYANFSEGYQVPGTDNLYNSFWYSTSTNQAKPKAERSFNYDAGVRYTSGQVVAMLAGWYTLYKNRLASAYDFDLDATIYRNLGTVDRYGIDGSVAYQPIRQLKLYAMGSYLKSKIRDDVPGGTCTTTFVQAGLYGCTTAGTDFLAPTAGKRESGAPTYTFGGRAEVDLDYVQFGIEAKRTGPRYVNDINQAVVQTYGNGTSTQYTAYTVYGAKAPAYNIVNLDVRVPMEKFGLNDRTYFQFNVTNLFDVAYVGGFSGTLLSNSVRNAYIGAPRAVSGTLVVGF